MKLKMKKLVSIVLAMAMVLTMSVTAFAADETTYTITINNTADGHEYEAYQIFAGTLSEKTLTAITWGSGVDTTKESEIYTALATIKDTSGTDTTYPFVSCTTAETVAEALASYNDSSDVAEAFADVISAYLTDSATASTSTLSDGAYTMTVTSAGYYLVKDKDNSLADKDDAYTDYILQVVGNVTVDAKSSSPSVTKKVQETNDSTGVTTGWQDAADYDIDDTIPYQLTGTMPSTLDDYTVYKYVFTDTLSKGLTVVTADTTIAETDVTVTVVTGSASTVVGTDYYTVTLTDYTGDDTTYTGGHVLTVSFDDVLSLKDESGNAISVTSASSIVVTYSAKLNDNAVIGSAGNPNEVYLTYSNNPNDTSGSETGQTPKDVVTVYTFKLEVNKTNENSVALKGATFALYKYSDEDGKYVIVETIDGTDASTFTFNGLDSGKYMISETKSPEGYNSIDDIYFVVVANYETTVDEPEFNSLEIQDANGNVVSGDSTSGKTYVVASDASLISTTVVNKSGSVLPSTGGIGTTIFYIVGAVLVLGAGVILVTRRRTRA